MSLIARMGSLGILAQCSILRALCARAGKIIRLRQKLTDAADSVKGFFGGKKQAESQVAKLEAVQVSQRLFCS